MESTRDSSVSSWVKANHPPAVAPQGSDQVRRICVPTGLALLVLSIALVSACAHGKPDMPPLRTVESVDFGRYVGTWYEIASFPHRFQEGCVASMAIYALRSDGQIAVENRCREGSFDGRERSVRGRAWVVDPATTAKLKVSFFWPFRGDYWIIDLDPDYQYAVVGHPSREYLWILSRTRRMDEAVFQSILKRLQDQGYDTARLRRTPQPES